MPIRVESPFPLAAVPRVWTWIQQFRSRVADDFAPDSMEAFVELWERKTAAGQRSWAVYRDGELGGLVTFEAWSPVCGTTHAIFRKDFWGHATTVPALEAAYAEIFASGVERLLSFAFRDNSNLIHMAKVLGGVKEGTHPKMTKRNGQLTDMVSIGLMREKFEAARAARQKEAA